MKKQMELNKETASRLWGRQFGKRQKAIDFQVVRLQRLLTMTGTVLMDGM